MSSYIKIHSRNDSNLSTKNKNKIRQNFQEFFNKNFIENPKQEKPEEKYHKINPKLKKFEIFEDAKEKAKKNFFKKFPVENYLNNSFEKTLNFEDVKIKFFDIKLINIV
jgi:hypothetical protein